MYRKLYTRAAKPMWCAVILYSFPSAVKWTGAIPRQRLGCIASWRMGTPQSPELESAPARVRNRAMDEGEKGRHKTGTGNWSRVYRRAMAFGRMTPTILKGPDKDRETKTGTGTFAWFMISHLLQRSRELSPGFVRAASLRLTGVGTAAIQVPKPLCSHPAVRLASRDKEGDGDEPTNPREVDARGDLLAVRLGGGGGGAGGRNPAA